MAGITITKINAADVSKILKLEEGHFCDLKAIEIAPSKLTRSLSAFANAEGGELYIGIDEEDRAAKKRTFRGFSRIEDANGHLQTFNNTFPLGQDCVHEFLQAEGGSFLLRLEIKKTLDIKRASDNNVYVRRGAQNLPLTTPEALEILRRDKGITSFESETVSVEHAMISNSMEIITYMLEVIPQSEPEVWLRKQQLIVNGKPTVAGVVLFADEPQTILPKRCGIKLYRYQTSDAEGTRESLAFDPLSIEGNAYKQIKVAVSKTAEIIESVGATREAVSYPINALHEIITNAVLHRDYYITDDIHIRVFDNRIEVVSPGTLAGHVTPENILNERFSRNPAIVRLINKFPSPPNKDIGEGLNTAFNAMRARKLKAPTVKQDGSSVIVTLKHEPLGSPRELILEYLKTHSQIRNKEARGICFIGDANEMKRIFQKMMREELLEIVPGTTRYNAAYRTKKRN